MKLILLIRQAVYCLNLRVHLPEQRRGRFLRYTKFFSLPSLLATIDFISLLIIHYLVTYKFFNSHIIGVSQRSIEALLNQNFTFYEKLYSSMVVELFMVISSQWYDVTITTPKIWFPENIHDLFNPLEHKWSTWRDVSVPPSAPFVTTVIYDVSQHTMYYTSHVPMYKNY